MCKEILTFGNIETEKKKLLLPYNSYFFGRRRYWKSSWLVVSDLRSETKGSRFESGCQLCAEVSSLQ